MTDTAQTAQGREKRGQEIWERVWALAGAHVDEAKSLLFELQELESAKASAETAELFQAVGAFIIDYDRHAYALWRALYLRLSTCCNCDTEFTGRNGGNYKNYDELRFLWGKDWRKQARDVKIPIPVGGKTD
jgi:hypothetical protein